MGEACTKASAEVVPGAAGVKGADRSRPSCEIECPSSSGNGQSLAERHHAPISNNGPAARP